MGENFLHKHNQPYHGLSLNSWKSENKEFLISQQNIPKCCNILFLDISMPIVYLFGSPKIHCDSIW